MEEGGEGGEGERKRGGGGKEAEEFVFRGRTGLRDGPWSVRMCSLAVECVLLLYNVFSYLETTGMDLGL